MKCQEGCKILITCLAIVWNSLWNFPVASFQWLQNCQKNGRITSNALVPTLTKKFLNPSFVFTEIV